MSRLTISSSKDYLQRDGKPFFYLADTIWTAFTNMTLEEWDEYLTFRRKQDFNALQVSILPLWDGWNREKLGLDVSPFYLNRDGTFDFFAINYEYFDRARTMVEIAAGKGFVPVLVLLWDNYVKPGWPNKPPVGLMPYEAVKPYTEYVVKLFSEYHPIYCVSGDSELDWEEGYRHYDTALDIVKQICPECLTTMHTSGPAHETGLKHFMQSPNLDFYMYQSSHKFDAQQFTYTYAEGLYKLAVKRPIVNGEPCYEAHAFLSRFGRFNEFDVRKAAWQSLLSGAKAGITYGALGIWNWSSDKSEPPCENSGGKSLNWRQALLLKGAWDMSFAKWIFETYGLFGMEPQDCILNNTSEIRMSATMDRGKVAIYIPYNVDVRVGMDLSGYDWTLIIMNEKLFAKPIIEKWENSSIIKMHDFNSDCLLIGTR